jgi:hypothetical protein
MTWCDIDLARSDIAGHGAASARRPVIFPRVVAIQQQEVG